MLINTSDSAENIYCQNFIYKVNRFAFHMELELQRFINQSICGQLLNQSATILIIRESVWGEVSVSLLRVDISWCLSSSVTVNWRQTGHLRTKHWSTFFTIWHFVVQTTDESMEETIDRLNIIGNKRYLHSLNCHFEMWPKWWMQNIC